MRKKKVQIVMDGCIFICPHCKNELIIKTHTMMQRGKKKRKPKGENK